MWRTFAESYLEALDAVGRADPERPRTVYGAFDETATSARNRLWDNLPLHSFQTLLADLGTICLDQIQPLRFGRTEPATAAVSVDEFGRGMVLWVRFAPPRR